MEEAERAGLKTPATPTATSARAGTSSYGNEALLRVERALGQQSAAIRHRYRAKKRKLGQLLLRERTSRMLYMPLCGFFVVAAVLWVGLPVIMPVLAETESSDRFFSIASTPQAVVSVLVVTEIFLLAYKVFLRSRLLAFKINFVTESTAAGQFAKVSTDLVQPLKRMSLILAISGLDEDLMGRDAQDSEQQLLEHSECVVRCDMVDLPGVDAHMGQEHHRTVVTDHHLGPGGLNLERPPHPHRESSVQRAGALCYLHALVFVCHDTRTQATGRLVTVHVCDWQCPVTFGLGN